MTLHSFVNRLTQLCSWLYYQHLWEEWELLAIGIVVLVPLLLIARRQRKERAGRIYTHHHPERSPIIGVKLANGKHSPPEITDSKKARSHSVERGKIKQDGAIKQVDVSNEQIKQLQCEIARHRQTEARLEQQLAELTAANEKLRQEIDKVKQTEEHHQQQTVELPAVNKELQEERVGRKRVKGPIHNQTDSAPAADKQPTDSKHANEPLDVEKLKAIAALARQIQQRPRPELT